MSLFTLQIAPLQVYTSPDKLLIDPSAVVVTPVDFATAMSRLVPASHRGSAPIALPLPTRLQPLCGAAVAAIMEGLKIQFPPSMGKKSADGAAGASVSTNITPNLQAYSEAGHGSTSNASSANGNGQQLRAPSGNFGSTFGRARLLVSGPPGCGQKEIALAVLHHLEEIPTFVLDLPSLLTDPSRSGSPPATVMQSHHRLALRIHTLN
jgi:hypothetical protein